MHKKLKLVTFHGLVKGTRCWFKSWVTHEEFQRVVESDDPLTVSMEQGLYTCRFRHLDYMFIDMSHLCDVDTPPDDIVITMVPDICYSGPPCYDQDGMVFTPVVRPHNRSVKFGNYARRI